MDSNTDDLLREAIFEMEKLTKSELHILLTFLCSLKELVNIQSFAERLQQNKRES
jgi:hypothetical protein